jgi:hypothetical protein
MIRLADSVAGFSRDQIEGGDYVKDFYKKMIGKASSKTKNPHG